MYLLQTRQKLFGINSKRVSLTTKLNYSLPNDQLLLKGRSTKRNQVPIFYNPPPSLLKVRYFGKSSMRNWWPIKPAGTGR